MYIREDGTIYFHEWDRPFVAKFGEYTATQMVLAFQTEHRGLPFLYDTHQLAAFLQMNRKRLFDLVKQVDEHYDRVEIVQKNGKKRVLHVPDGTLKAVQRQIQRNILMHFLPSSYATAYIRRRTLVDNAAPHVGKRYLLKLDITDFFGSIRFAQVYRSAFCSPYFPKQVGVLLTRLCCWQGALPQGAPTSPALSNLVMKSFDVYLGEWCRRHAIAYTRYCDDMTFSADHPLYMVYQKVQTMLEHMGFSLHEDKTCFVTRAARQCVTGLTVNETVLVSRVYKRRLRQELYYAQKFGLADSLRHTQRGEFFTGETPDVERYRNHLLGQVGFVLQVEPENGWFQHARDVLRKIYMKRSHNSMGKIKKREFFTRSAEELAKDLIGKNLCHLTYDEDGEPFIIKGRIKVTEAYLRDEDFTDENREKDKTSQALEGGHLHLHTKCCEGRKRLDVVANKVDVSEGVLICGLDPYEDGPQRVVWAMEILDSADGMDMLKDDAEIWIEDDGTQAELKEPTKRKNIPDDKPLRFAAKSFLFK